MRGSWAIRSLCLGAAFVVVPSMVSAACPGDTQREMNDCAHQRYQAADAKLNAAWKPAKALYDDLDRGDVLLDAQRKWLAFRDAACAAEIAPYEGGSIQPLIYSDCMTRLTRQRTKTLRNATSN